MPADLRDVLARAAASAGDAGEPDVARAVRRGAALRTRRAVAAVATVVVLLGAVVSGALVLTGGSGGGRSVSVATPPDGDPVGAGWPTVHNDRYDVSWQVPPEWQSTTDKLTTNLLDPAGVLAAGTFPLRSDAGACLTPDVAQHMAPTDVYVALFLWLHRNGGFPDRPERFGPDLGSSNVLPCIDVPGASARLIDFTDHGLELSALVIIGNDASPQRRAEAYAVLDSIRLGTGTAPLTSVPTTVPATVPATASGTSGPLAPATVTTVGAGVGGGTPPTTSYPDGSAEAQVVAAFLGWTDTRPLDAKSPYVQDFDQIKATMEQAHAQAPPGLDRLHGVVQSVTIVDSAHAHVVYGFVNGDQPVVSGLPGDLVKIDGKWKVTRETVCASFALEGVHCP